MKACSCRNSNFLLVSMLQVKRIMRFMTYAMYNARLETAFLVDEYALPSQLMSSESPQSVDLFGSMTTTPISPIIADVKAMHVRSNSLPLMDKCEGTRDDEEKLSRIIREVDSPETPGLRPAMDENIFQCSIPNSEPIGQSAKESVHQENSDRFRKALDELALSVSPFVRYAVPYLKTEAGSRCLLRHFFPLEIYWSKHMTRPLVSDDVKHEPSVNSPTGASPSPATAVPKSVVAFLPSHPFVIEKLTEPACSSVVQVGAHAFLC